MLDTFRNSAKGTAGKVVVGLIVITFVLFGAESIISIAGNSSPATVNGDDISELDYQRLLSSRQQELTNQFGAEVAAQLANSPFLQQEIIESLVSQAVQSQMASELDFDVSEDQVLKSFADVPAFQIDGKFDQDRYLNVLAASGFTHQSFMSAQRNQSSLTQLQAGIANSAFSLDKTVQRYASLDTQQRSFQFKQFVAADYANQVELTDDELNNYYLENESQYMSEEKVKVKYLTVRLEDLAKEQVATEAELQSAYDSYVVGLSAQDSREISHILFADGEDNVAEANDALTRLSNGESFADLATELSDDPGSAEFGGSLGQLIPDVYVQEFYDAAVALKEVGEVSGLVETQYGIHLIRLDSISTAPVESFEAKKDELLAEIQMRKARDEILQVEAQLSDAAFSSDDIADVADSFQVSVTESDWLTRADNTGVFAEASVLEEAFSAQVVDDGLISNVVRMSDDDLIVMQLVEHQPEEVKPFTDVEDQVRAAVVAIKSSELMTADLQTLVESNEIQGSDWTSTELVTRDSTDYPSEVVAKAFELASNTVGTTEGEQSAYAVFVTEVNTPEVDAATVANAQSFVDSVVGGTQYQIVYNQSRNEADVTVRR